jgi:hypothetical protein
MAGSSGANPGIERRVTDPDFDCPSALRRPAPQELNCGIALPPFGLSDSLLGATEAFREFRLGQPGFLASKAEEVPDRIRLPGRQLSLALRLLPLGKTLRSMLAQPRFHKLCIVPH